MKEEEVMEVCISELYGKFVREYGREPDAAEILDMARWAWRCRADTPRLVFAEAEGEIKGVIEVDRWYNCGEARANAALLPNVRPNGTREIADVQNDIAQNRRKAFVGHISTRGQYVGQNVPGFGGNPVRYVTLRDEQLPQR